MALFFTLTVLISTINIVKSHFEVKHFIIMGHGGFSQAKPDPWPFKMPVNFFVNKFGDTLPFLNGVRLFEALTHDLDYLPKPITVVKPKQPCPQLMVSADNVFALVQGIYSVSQEVVEQHHPTVEIVPLVEVKMLKVISNPNKHVYLRDIAHHLSEIAPTAPIYWVACTSDYGRMGNVAKYSSLVNGPANLAAHESRVYQVSKAQFDKLSDTKEQEIRESWKFMISNYRDKSLDSQWTRKGYKQLQDEVDDKFAEMQSYSNDIDKYRKLVIIGQKAVWSYGWRLCPFANNHMRRMSGMGATQKFKWDLWVTSMRNTIKKEKEELAEQENSKPKKPEQIGQDARDIGYNEDYNDVETDYDETYPMLMVFFTSTLLFCVCTLCICIGIICVLLFCWRNSSKKNNISQGSQVYEDVTV